jgi:hypothetical protein
MKSLRSFGIALAACTAVLGSMALPAASQPLWGRFDQRFDPISVDSVTVDRRGLATHGINIVYHDNRQVAAQKVVFQVNYRGVVQSVVDVGNFTQGAEINHTFNDFDGLGYEGPTPDRIQVVYVAFADGTVWQQPRY